MVGAPTLKKSQKVVGEGRLEMEVLSCRRVDKSEDKSMEGLSWHNVEAIGHELLILGEGGAFEDSVATVGGIGEERVPDMSHVGTNLMGAARFEDTFDERDITKTFEDMPMGDGVLARLIVVGEERVEGIDRHDATVARRASETSIDGAGIGVEVAPDKSMILAFDRVVEKLFGEKDLGVFVFSDEEKAGSILIDAVDKERLDRVAVGIVFAL